MSLIVGVDNAEQAVAAWSTGALDSGEVAIDGVMHTVEHTGDNLVFSGPDGDLTVEL